VTDATMLAAFAAQALSGVVTCPSCLGAEWVFDLPETDWRWRHWHCADCQRILLEGRDQDPRRAAFFVLVGRPAFTAYREPKYRIPFAQQRLEFP
jgi:hypothetical protein